MIRLNSKVLISKDVKYPIKRMGKSIEKLRVLSLGFSYFPMPIEAAGAAALRMNSAKIRMVVSFFISNLL